MAQIKENKYRSELDENTTFDTVLSIIDFLAKFHQIRARVGKVSIWGGLSRSGWVGWWLVKPSQPLSTL